jgi:hypothetical protein
MEALRLTKESGSRNGAVPLIEAIVALGDGRALEASEYAELAAVAETVDFGDREAALDALAAGEAPAARPVRDRAVRELLDFLIAWGEEWEWRGRKTSAKSAYAAAARLAERLAPGVYDAGEALALSNLAYRGRHRLAGLALRAGEDSEFATQAALANEAHVLRTGLAASQNPSTLENWRSIVEIGWPAAIHECPEPPDHPVKALLEAPHVFRGKAPTAALVLALGDHYGARELALRWDAALALLPHARQVAPSLRRWIKNAPDPSAALALLAAAGEKVEAGEDFTNPWRARACAQERRLESSLKVLSGSRRLPVAFRLRDLRGEDEIELCTGR